MAEVQEDLGQHLLHDERAIERVLSAVALQSGETVMDAGAGTGALTHRALHAVGPTGRVYAVEIDPAMLEVLRLNAPPQLRIVEKNLVEMKIPPKLDAVVANPPFKIAAHLLRRVANLRGPRAVFVLPQELVDRLVAAPGSPRYGKLTVQIALAAHVEDLGQISRYAFQPPPGVACGLVRMVPRNDTPRVDSAMLGRTLDAAWESWTKKAKGAFDGLARELRIDSAGLTSMLKENGWAEQPASNLTPEAFAAVAQYLVTHRKPDPHQPEPRGP